MALRSGLKYKYLGHHVFFVDEKQWACRHLTAGRVGDIACESLSYRYGYR